MEYVYCLPENTVNKVNQHLTSMFDVRIKGTLRQHDSNCEAICDYLGLKFLYCNLKNKSWKLI